MLRVDGSSVIVEGRGVRTIIDGKPSIQVALRDITERKRAEEALRESEGKLNAMLQSVPDIMSMMDKDLTIMWANEPAKRYFGKDLIGKKCYEAYHLRSDPCEPCLTLKAFLDGKTRKHETTVIDSQGEERFFECTATVALLDNSGNPAAVLEISRDITDKKKTEEALRESEGTFRSLVQESSDGIVIVDEEGRVIVWNNAVTQISGIHGDEALGNLYIDLIVSTIVPEQRGHDRIERIRTIIDEEIQTGTSLFFSRSLEAEIIRRDGERRYIQQTAFPIRTANGFRIGSIIRDITERKREEEALRESEEKYRTLIDRANDGICIIQDKIIR
jgi:PAS domain S-box-containing protein